MKQANNNSKSYYEILGISREATLKEIKKSYHELARLYHPDSNFYADIIDDKLNSQQIELFKIITSAYHTLIDPEKRKTYDSSLLPPPREFSSNWESGSSDEFWSKSSQEKQPKSNLRKRSSTFGQTGIKPFKSSLHGELKRPNLLETATTKKSKQKSKKQSNNLLLMVGLGTGLALSILFIAILFNATHQELEPQSAPEMLGEQLAGL